MGVNFFDPDFLPPLREVIGTGGLSARHGLGQHFLLDINLIRRIAASAGDLAGKTVIEVGPGPGGLTRGLLEVAGRVIAIERDRRCLEALAPLVDAAEGRLTLIDGDATEISPNDLLETGESAAIVANLPYNAGTQMLINWLRDLSPIDSMTLMFQKEVAERITALSGSRAYGRLSVLAQWLCETEKLFEVPAAAFVPPPKVVSTVIALRPRAAPAFPAEFSVLETMTRAAFGQRRKMLRSSLKSAIADPLEILEEAGIDPTLRAENLSVDNFCAIARAHAVRRAPDRPNTPPEDA